MIDVIGRSITGRMCDLAWEEGALRTPALIHAELETVGPAQPPSVRGEEGKLRLSIAGKDIEMDLGMRRPLTLLGGHPSVSEGEATVVRALGEDVPQSIGGGEVVVVANAFEMRRDPRALVELIPRLRRAVGPHRLLYAPGLAEVGDLALLAYLGIDLFDTTSLVLHAVKGRITLPEGNLHDEGMELDERVERNIAEAERELSLVREMIARDRLRELVEMRSLADPWAVAVLRLFDSRAYAFQEERSPVVGSVFHCNSVQSLYRPDVRRFRERVMSTYRPAGHKRVLVLLPCSAKKPYFTSKSHRRYMETIRRGERSGIIQEMIVTSPLGLVPRELETFYPAAQYDIPVTGDWRCQERDLIGEMVSRIPSYGFDHIISHLGSEGEFVNDVIDCVDTSHGEPTSFEALERLDQELKEVCSDLPPVSRMEDRIGTMEAILRYQFGSAEAIMDRCHVTGKYPYWKIFDRREQVGMLTPERGMVSLTLEGGRRLMEQGVHWVRMDDFKLKGNLFAIGVREADPNIRIGDEVVVTRSGELAAVGVAQMCGADMVAASRDIAVKVRHRVK